MTTESGSAAPGSAERLLASPLRRLLTWRSDVDGRVVLVAAITLYLGIIAAGRLGWGFDLWPYLGVPSGPSLFFDARNLTASWECQRLGYDPLYDNPCDPWRRPLMYLRPWLLLGVFGLDQSHTVALSVVLVAAMFVSFFVLVGRVPLGTGILLAVAACSPAVMLAVERANMDVALFSLVAFSVLLWRRFPSAARIVSPLLILLGATAKVYPAFALPAFVVTRSRVAAWVALLCVAAFGVYVIVHLRDVRHAAQIAIQGDGFSYGARILIAHLYHQVGADRWSGPAAMKQLIAAVPVAFAAAAIAVRIRRRFARRIDQAADTTASLLALHVGALIYLGTFVVANNFDYRLVFLLLTLPQLAAWARTPGDQLSSMSSITLVGILVLLWIGSLSEWLHLWDELASWGVAGLLAAIVAATVPRTRVIRQTVFRGLTSAPSGR
jgi:hypothetical protein